MDRGLSLTGSGKCYGGIQNGAPNLSIWGDVFLKSQYVVFDGTVGSERIGFSRQAVEVVPAIGLSADIVPVPS